MCKTGDLLPHSSVEKIGIEALVSSSVAAATNVFHQWICSHCQHNSSKLGNGSYEMNYRSGYNDTINWYNTCTCRYCVEIVKQKTGKCGPYET